MNTTQSVASAPSIASAPGIAIEQNHAKRASGAARIAQAVRQNETRCVLPAGEWLRRMTGFQAPFGHDGLPTVWG